MKKRWVVLLSLLFDLGCQSVSSGLPTSTAVNGDVWYAKDTRFLFMTFGTDVYYCPKDRPGHCIKAIWCYDQCIAPAAPPRAVR